MLETGPHLRHKVARRSNIDSDRRTRQEAHSINLNDIITIEGAGMLFFGPNDLAAALIDTF